MTPDPATDGADDAWPDEAWEAEQRDALAYEIAHPVYDPQQQPDGSYRDADAERRSDLASLADAFETSAQPPIAAKPSPSRSMPTCWPGCGPRFRTGRAR